MLMLSSVVSSLTCCNSSNDAAQQGMVDAACECKGQVEQAAALCTQARDVPGSALVTTSREIRDDLSHLGGTDGLDASVFYKLRDFVDKNQTRQARDAARGLEDLAKQILDRTTAMDQSLNKGIDSLPEDLREQCAAEYDEKAKARATPTTQSRGMEGVDEEELERQLLDVDTDIAELENASSQTRGFGGRPGLSIFSASTTGTAVLEGTTAKGKRCQDLLTKMRDLCGAVIRLLKAMVAPDNCCCTRLRAIAAMAASLFQCRHLVALLRKVAEAVMRLVEAIGKVLDLAWDRFQGFLSEFDAAKKLGRFASGVMNSGVGRLATGIVSNILPGGNRK